MADSDENGANKTAAALPSTSACQLSTPFHDPQLQQGGNVNASQYTSYGLASQKQGSYLQCGGIEPLPFVFPSSNILSLSLPILLFRWCRCCQE